MTSIMILRLLGLLLFLIVSDLLAWLGMRRLIILLNRNPRIFSRIWWSLSVVFLLSYLIFLLVTGTPGNDYTIMRKYFAFFGVFLMLYLPKAILSVVYLLDNIGGLLFRAAGLNPGKLSKILGFTGSTLAIFMFFSVLYGMIEGRYRFTIKEVEIRHPLLPSSFDGYRILQYSDTHLGSFPKPEKAIRGFKLIAAQEADIIAFTGDLINILPEEAEPYREVLTSITASDGKYAVLGNHDLDDYRKWDHSVLRSEETEALVRFHHETGSVVLRNSHKPLVRNADTIYIAGVDNWGVPPFKMHGDLQKALSNIPTHAFVILLSHDPSHWDEEVLPHTHTALTLSGHTHGMQFALNLGKKKWSPISRMYRHWYGLFEENGQYMYVNPGFGFIGFNGRVGMPPEITIITLRAVEAGG